MSREPGAAPGLEWKKRPKDGVRIPRWRARKKAVAAGYRPSVIQLDIYPTDHAALADELHMQPSQLNVAVPEWTQSTVERIFATHLEDWPALLRSACSPQPA